GLPGCEKYARERVLDCGLDKRDQGIQGATVRSAWAGHRFGSYRGFWSRNQCQRLRTRPPVTRRRIKVRMTPPMMAPTMPTMMSTRGPKPAPRMIFPVMYPATRPMTIQTRSECVPWVDWM